MKTTSTLFKKMILLAVFLPLALVAQIPAGYYSTAEGKNRAELKTALHNRIKGHTRISYTPGVWNAFRSTDIRSNDTIWDMYTSINNCVFIWRVHQEGQPGAPTGSGECVVYNREHSWPQSWFGGSISPMHTDLFHIYPTCKEVNARRSNYPYGEVGTATWTSANGSKLGNARSGLGYSGRVFEPIDEYKGDFARTYFYMVTRYEDLLASWFAITGNAAAGGRATINGTTYPAFQPWQLQMLLRWHRQDPVSQKEIARNDSVFKIQNNRNPFIDHPELVEYIWGDSTAFNWSAPQSPEPTLTVTPHNLDFGIVAVDSTSFSQTITIFGHNLSGEILYEKTDNIYSDFDTTTLLLENFGNAATGVPWPWIAVYNDFQRGGAGATNVTYTQATNNTVSVRNNSVSNGYPNASGGCNVMMAAAGATFFVNNIDPMGFEKISLSFGSNETNTILAVAFSTNGTSWTNIPYQKSTNTWGLVNAEFEIPSQSTMLSLRFTAGATEFGTRVDDIIVKGIKTVEANDNNAFSVTELSWNPTTGGILNVTFLPKKEHVYNAALTFKSTDVDDKIVVLSGIGIVKKSGATVTKPTLDNITHESKTINPVTPPTTGQNVEYAISKINSAPTENWQIELTFEDLEPGTIYYTFARAEENHTHLAGIPSEALMAITLCEISNDLALLDIISALQDSIEKLHTDTLRLYDSIGKLYQQLTAYNSQNTALRDSIGTLHQQLTVSNTQNSKLNDTISARDSRIATLLNNISTLQNDTTKLQDSIRELWRLLNECRNSGTSNATFMPQNQIEIYPNPVVSELRIVIPSEARDLFENNAVELFDMNGRRVFFARMASTPLSHRSLSGVEGNVFTIDMSAFQQGNYILRIGNRVAKIVKQ